MLETEAWDALLERLTAQLAGFASGRGGTGALESPTWTAHVQADRRSVAVRLQLAADNQERLDDYQLVLIYSAGYDPGRGYPPVSFSRGMTLREGFQWDEQSLREVVLELLGIFRHVLKVEVASLSLAAPVTRPTVPVARRFRRSGR